MSRTLKNFWILFFGLSLLAPLAAADELIQSDNVSLARLSAKMSPSGLVDAFSIKLSDHNNSARVSFNVFSDCKNHFEIRQVLPGYSTDKPTDEAGFEVKDKEGKGKDCVDRLLADQKSLKAGAGCSNAQIKRGEEIVKPFTCEPLSSELDLSLLRGKVKIGVFGVDSNFEPKFDQFGDTTYTDPQLRAMEKADRLAKEKEEKIKKAKETLDCPTCGSKELETAFKDLLKLKELKDEVEIQDAQTKVTTRRLEELSKQIKAGKSNDKVRKDLLDLARKDPRMTGDVASLFAQIASDIPERDMDRLFGEMKELNQIATGSDSSEVHDMLADAMYASVEKMIERKENPGFGDYKKAEKYLKAAKGLAGVSSDKKRTLVKEISAVKQYQFSIIAAGSDPYAYMIQARNLQAEASKEIQKSCRTMSFNGATRVSDACTIAKQQYVPLMSSLPQIFQKAQMQKAQEYQQQAQLEATLMNSMNGASMGGGGLFNSGLGGAGGLSLGGNTGTNQSLISQPGLQTGLNLR